MKATHAFRAGAVVIAALACLVISANPASATVHTYNVTMESGRISVGTQNFDTPGSGATGCTPPAVGTTGIVGAIDDVAGTITGALSISSLFSVPPLLGGGNYALIATTTATTAGTYTSTLSTFVSLTVTVAFTVRTVVSCAPTTTTVCSGSATLTASGGAYNGATLPLSTSEQMYVNATGTITARGTCGFPFNLFITVGTSISLSDNPNDDVAPTGTDPGAIFHQV